MSNEKERKPKGKSWSISDKIAATSIVATFVVSIASLIVSIVTKSGAERSAQTAEASRVETGNLSSNSNEETHENPWRPWTGNVSSKTIYVGVRRLIPFKRAFGSAPDVSVAFSVINVKSSDEVLAGLGFKADAEMLSRLKQFHVVSFVETPTAKDFVLEVGIGLPTEAGIKLKDALLQTPLPQVLVDDMREHRQLKADAPDTDERWMANFFELVGTFGLSWTAQAKP